MYRHVFDKKQIEIDLKKKLIFFFPYTGYPDRSRAFFITRSRTTHTGEHSKQSTCFSNITNTV